MILIDPTHPFYRPLWVRIAIVAVCFAWAAVEIAIGAPFWGVLFGGAGLYAVFVFFMHHRASGGKGPTP
ncbi:MAG: hypothetical protein IPL47_02460 [Phyllobacteriaceae bacterium]|nr:hypothetical protein [Phyllobacteriaceae bacterium]